MFSQVVSYDFPLARTLARICFVHRPRRPLKSRRRCESRRLFALFEAIWSWIWSWESLYKFCHCSSLSQLIMLALGNRIREMLTLHTNPHAVQGRFSLKYDCERQFGNEPFRELQAGFCLGYLRGRTFPPQIPSFPPKKCCYHYNI